MFIELFTNRERPPPGHDALGQFIRSFKWGLFVGLPLATWRATMYSQGPDHKDAVRRFGRTLFPCMGMALGFGITAFIAGDLRQKDDEWNNVLGAMVATGVFYSATGHKFPSMLMLLYGTALAAIQKNYALRGEYLITKPTQPRYWR